MSESRSSANAGGAIRTAGATPSALGVADWLSYAAAPTFAAMALLTAVLDAGPPSPICSVTRDLWPLSGMASMYLLMSVFHLAPWLKLTRNRRTPS